MPGAGTSRRCGTRRSKRERANAGVQWAHHRVRANEGQIKRCEERAKLNRACTESGAAGAYYAKMQSPDNRARAHSLVSYGVPHVFRVWESLISPICTPPLSLSLSLSLSLFVCVRYGRERTETRCSLRTRAASRNIRPPATLLCCTRG